MALWLKIIEAGRNGWKRQKVVEISRNLFDDERLFVGLSGLENITIRSCTVLG